ncbi:MAG TPA: aminoglycoside phosphotransferase family protein [Candidatus Ozemobacteraceae bacterium]|nr:aminoglycoside phosphotransferase family protein [Candidatus Ozemobacteraceae bacterium]
MTSNGTFSRPSETDPAALHAAAEFLPTGAIERLQPLGNGNIHHTWLVTPDGTTAPFVLQQLNTRVFPRPDLVMANIRRYTDHARRRLHEAPLPDGRDWIVPDLLRTRGGEDLLRGADGSCWRALGFIPDTIACDTIETEAHAREAGVALGIFHALVGDLGCDRLADTLEGFHVTPGYLARFDRVCAENPRVAGRTRLDGAVPPSPSEELEAALAFVTRRRHLAGTLEEARETGRLRLRPIHGDPKVNNILFARATGRAISMIDLDTVKPGLVHYDIGDCLRSGCNRLGEETAAWRNVRFDLSLAREILRGYLSMVRSVLTSDELAFIPQAPGLIAFELGLRFLTDHIQGDIYFKAAFPGHNLRRALVQFRLCESVDEQADALAAIVRELT